LLLRVGERERTWRLFEAESLHYVCAAAYATRRVPSALKISSERSARRYVTAVESTAW